MQNPIYDWDLDYFNRGPHQSESLHDVARYDPRYIHYLATKADLLNREEPDLFANFILKNRDLFEVIFS